MKKVGTVHFVIEGEWLTQLLRGMWVEGNEVGAIKVWNASFPKITKPSDLKDTFIRLVSGKAKFTGDSDGNGFNLEDDDSPYFEGDKSLPLLNSWEDVILLKKARLYVAELELRAYRLRRRYPDTFAKNAWEWAEATEENRAENGIRREVNRYYTDVRNLCIQFGVDIKLEMLPVNESPLLTGPTFMTRFKKPEGKRNDIATYIQCKEAYVSAMEFLGVIDTYFKTKYGKSIRTFDLTFVKDSCGIDTEYEDQMDKLATRYLEDNTPSLPDFKNIVPELDVDKYLQDMVNEEQRTEVEPEDPKTTEWTSGYIDRDGRFYGCSDLGHILFADTLCEKLGLYPEDEDEESTPDSSQILDNLGWIKVSMKRFFWDSLHIKPTGEQQATIFDFMMGKKMNKAVFNEIGQWKTLGEAFGDDF